MHDLGTLGEGTDSVTFSINEFGQVQAFLPQIIQLAAFRRFTRFSGRDKLEWLISDRLLLSEASELHSHAEVNEVRRSSLIPNLRIRRPTICHIGPGRIGP